MSTQDTHCRPLLTGGRVFRGHGRPLGRFACLCLFLGLIGSLYFWPSGVDAAKTSGVQLSAATLKLFQAVEVNDMPGVKAALRDGADQTAKNGTEKTAADIAVDKGHFIIAHFLLSQLTSAAKKVPAPTASPPLSTSTSKPAPRKLVRIPTRPRTMAPSAPAKTGAKTGPQTTSRKSTRPAVAGKKGFRLPPRKPKPQATATTRTESRPVTRRRFALAPRKPPPPLPSASDIATSPGLRPGADGDLPPEVESEAAELPDVETNTKPAAGAAATAKMKPEASPIGRFFDSLLRLVKPDDPEPAAKPSPPATQTAAVPKSASSSGTTSDSSTAASPPAEPAQPGDTVTAEDLDELLPDAPEGDTAAIPEPAPDTDPAPPAGAAEQAEASAADPPASDSATPGERSIDDELADLDNDTDDLPADTGKPAVASPSVRRIGPKTKAVQKAGPAPTMPKDAAMGPAKSSAGRTLDRVKGLIKPPPREDEFGLPVIDLPGEDAEEAELPPETGDLPDPPPAADGDTLAADTPALPAGKLPPVDALPASSRRSPRYQSTLDQLRRLGEAVAREIKPDTDSILAVGRRARGRRLENAPAGAAIDDTARNQLPVGTGQVTKRESSTSRIIKRLEGIRRDSYANEGAKGPTPTPTPKKSLPKPAAADTSAKPESEDKGVVSALARFFRSSRPTGKSDETAASRVSPDYRRAPDQGLKTAPADTDAPAHLVPRAADSPVAAPKPDPKPGQKSGTMAPGILENLSRLFTDQEAGKSAWSADVELVGPDSGAASDNAQPAMKRVTPGSSSLSGAVSQSTDAAPPVTLPPPGEAQPGAWTTTVEMTTKTGEQMVVGVSKTPGAPRPSTTAAAPPAEIADLSRPGAAPDTAPDTAPDADLPPATGETQEAPDDPLGDLPPAEGEEQEATGTPEPGSENDPLGDLPPAEGEAPDGPAMPAKAKRSARATPPYSDPLRAPNPAPKSAPARPQSTLARTGTLKPGPNEPAPPSGDLKLGQDERLATAKSRRPPTQGQVAARQQAGSGAPWPVTHLAKSDVRRPVSRRPRPAMLTRTSLTGANFTLGDSVSLENSVPPDGGIDSANQCVKKNRGTTLFCIEPVDWPAPLQPKFVVPTILYTGTMAIVRYDQGTASRLHALFPSAEFQTVAEFYRAKYGEPTEIWKRSIAPLAEPRRDNPTLAWRSRDPKTNAVTILEVRQYDDTRGGFPDTNRGAVMLYMANSPAIFPQVSSHELMRLKRDQAKKPG